MRTKTRFEKEAKGNSEMVYSLQEKATRLLLKGVKYNSVVELCYYKSSNDG